VSSGSASRRAVALATAPYAQSSSASRAEAQSHSANRSVSTSPARSRHSGRSRSRSPAGIREVEYPLPPTLLGHSPAFSQVPSTVRRRSRGDDSIGGGDDRGGHTQRSNSQDLRDDLNWAAVDREVAAVAVAEQRSLLKRTVLKVERAANEERVLLRSELEAAQNRRQSLMRARGVVAFAFSTLDQSGDAIAVLDAMPMPDDEEEDAVINGSRLSAGSGGRRSLSAVGGDFSRRSLSVARLSAGSAGSRRQSLGGRAPDAAHALEEAARVADEAQAGHRLSIERLRARTVAVGASASDSARAGPGPGGPRSGVKFGLQPSISSDYSDTASTAFTDDEALRAGQAAPHPVIVPYRRAWPP